MIGRGLPVTSSGGRYSSDCARPSGSGSGSRGARIHTICAVVVAPTLDRTFARWCLTVKCDRPSRRPADFSDPVASTAATSLTSRSVARWGWARRQSRHAHWNHSEGSGNPEARIETGRSSVAERFPLSSRAASHLANSRRVRPAEQVRGLADIDAARSTVQPREVLPGRRLADLQLVGGTGERARRDVGPQDLELAPGGALTDGGRHTHSARRPVAAWRSSESG